MVWAPKAQLFPGETWLFGLINKLKAESVGGWGEVCVGGGTAADRCSRDKRDKTSAHEKRLQRNMCQLMGPGWGCWSRSGFFSQVS